MLFGVTSLTIARATSVFCFSGWRTMQRPPLPGSGLRRGAGATTRSSGAARCAAGSSSSGGSGSVMTAAALTRQQQQRQQLQPLAAGAGAGLVRPLPLLAAASSPALRRPRAVAAGAAAASAAAQQQHASSSNGNGSGTPAPAPRPRAELPKNFDPEEGEARLYAFWEASGHFAPNLAAPKAPYTLPMPPPNVTGKLHMGHAMFVTLQDIMARYRRMAGHPTLWLPGTDHAGIATQSVVEKALAAAGGPSRAELGREAFEARVWEWKEEYGGAITRQMRRLGASCDWSRERFTLDSGLSAAVAEAFVRLHEKGLVYR